MFVIKKISSLLILLLMILVYSGCKDNFPVVDDLANHEYALVNQNDKQVDFPALTRGKITVAGYIYTNCPDICPLTTNNMQRIQKLTREGNIPDIDFVTITFDPKTDTPEVLKKYTEIRNLDLSNWTFLTGKKSTIDSLIDKAGVMAVRSDSTVFKDGHKIYYYIHTDRIQLIDKDGKIRKNYKGSRINVNEIVEDIKKLSDE